MKTEKISDKMSDIGCVGNYYGGLKVVEHEGKYYWIIEDYNTYYDKIEDWEEIPKYLYDSLIKFQTELDSKTHTEECQNQ